MIHTDQHVHTTFSYDGRQTMAEAGAAFAARGFTHVCLTEHVDMGHPDPACRGLPPVERWLRAVERLRQSHPQMTWAIGLEVGDNPLMRREIERFVGDMPLDFRLLSLHVVDGVDCYDPAFYRGRSRGECYRAYARALMRTLDWDWDFDALAHIGYCAKFAPYPQGERAFCYADAPAELDAVLRAVIRRGACIEINTSGLEATGSCFPHGSILRRYVELGGDRCTFGSDAHDTARDGAGMAAALAAAREAGIPWGAVFRQRKARLFALT